jgi:sugar phosphate isomerase/epimerase
MNISIASFSFHGAKAAGTMDVFGYLETCRYRYGLSTADIWNGLISSNPEFYLNDEFLKKLKADLDERELTLVNYHADGCHVWEDEPEQRARNRTLALRHLHAGELLGAKTVRIDAGGRGHTWTSQQFDTIAAAFGEYCKIADGAGFRLGPESHWGPELVPDNMEALARSVNHPAFGILLHLGHWENAPIEEGDRRLAKWAMHTHVDQKTTENRLESAMKILLDAGYTGCWGVEHHSGKNEYAEVAVQLAAVRRAVARLTAADAGVAGRSGRNHLIGE